MTNPGEHELPDPSDDQRRSLAAQAVGAAAGAVAGGFISDGAAGAALGAALGPLASEALRLAAQELRPWQRWSAGKALTTAADELSVEPEALVSRATSDADRAQLLASALTAAAATANEQKISALAKALARGLRDDDARIDEEFLVIAALTDVEAPHIRVLTQLGPERTQTRIARSNARSRTAPRRGLRPELLAAESGLSVPGVRAVLSVLERTGMAAADPSGETRRLEALIFELQEEVNKLTALALKPPAKPPTGSSKPKKINRPGSPARVGWTMSPFGQVCLDYLDGLDPDDSWGVVRDGTDDGDAEQRGDEDGEARHT